MELTPEQREWFVQKGKEGGRPRTVSHRTDGYCRCADCRQKKPPETKVNGSMVERRAPEKVPVKAKVLKIGGKEIGK